MSELVPDGGVVNLGFARIDSDRRTRCGRPEVIFGQGKTAEEIARIASVIHEREGHVLATRVSEEQALVISGLLPQAVYHGRARCLTLGSAPVNAQHSPVGVLCAGTSDLPVAEEAAITLEAFGRSVERIMMLGWLASTAFSPRQTASAPAACWSWWRVWRVRFQVPWRDWLIFRLSLSRRASVMGPASTESPPCLVW